ncbi:MAG: hypothetical protein LIO42_04970, partial [Oscillospiraceae bacterium]|nr:hypothetical protein [Oscillospiraceae bacterium]
MNLQELSPA